MILHNFSEDKNLNAWGEVFVNGERAILTYSRVSALPYNIWWEGEQRTKRDTEEAPFISFESNEKVEIRIKKDKIEQNSEIVVRPQSKAIKVNVKNGEACFTLTEHGAYTFEIDGFHEALHVFYNPERDFLAEEKKSGRKIIHYKAGTYDIGNVELPSHTSVIIDKGAVVYGSFSAMYQEDVRICGYGIIDGSKEVRDDSTLLLPQSVDIEKGLAREIYCIEGDLIEEDVLRKHLKDCKVLNGLIRFYWCKNFSVEGVIMRDSSTFCFIPAACTNFTIDNIKAIGMWRYNSDGIDLFNCDNAIIKNSFLRNFDDCMVIKGICGWDKRNNENILVENCTIWCDWGSALEIGAETNADEYNNIVFKDCNIIHSAHVSMRIHHHNRASIKNIVYKNICVDVSKHTLSPLIIEEGKEYFGESGYLPDLFQFVIKNHGLFCYKKVPGTIDGVTVDNIRIFKDEVSEIPRVVMYGCDDEHKVRNVRIGAIFINGEKIEDGAKLLDIGSFVEDVSVQN